MSGPERSSSSDNSKSERSVPYTTRRGAVGALASSLVLAGSPQIVSGRDSTTIIVEKGKDWSVTKLVPKQWYQRTIQVKKVRDALDQRYRANSFVTGVGITVTTRTTDGLLDPTPSIYLRPGTDKQQFPDRIDGVQVDKQYRRPPIPLGESDKGCYNNTTPSGDYYGGYLVQSSRGTGTTCCSVLKDQTVYMMGANHVFKSDQTKCDEDTSGLPLYSAGELVGHTTYNFDEEYDYMLIEEDGNVNFAGYLREPPATYQQVAGHFTYDGVQYLASTNKEVIKKIGIETGTQKNGVIKEYDVHYTDERICQDWYGGIITSNCSAGGDSGGPIFVPTEYQDNSPPGDVSIIAMTFGTTADATVVGSSYNETDIYSEAQGPSAYKLNNKFGIQFDF